MKNIPFRLIVDRPRPAAENMAIDEVLMQSQALEGCEPALRIYSWAAPAVSVGYFQNVAKLAERFECPKQNRCVVRRLTGGGAVLHGRDITFSLTLKNPNPFFSGEVKNSYLKINEALRRSFTVRYPSLDYADCRHVPSARGKGERICFEAPSCYDLLLGGKKVAGGSQRRIAGTILHQTTLFLEEDPAWLAQKIIEGFERQWRAAFKEEPLSIEELERARKIEKERYSSREWFYPALFLEASFLA